VSERKRDSETENGIGGAGDLEQSRRSLIPAYKVAAERVDFWKAREQDALEKKVSARGILSRIFWQIRYLSAVGNGAEAERCRDGLFDPHWGIIGKAEENRAAAHAIESGIRRHNEKTREKTREQYRP